MEPSSSKAQHSRNNTAQHSKAGAAAHRLRLQQRLELLEKLVVDRLALLLRHLADAEGRGQRAVGQVD